jgi:hypothetical protein
VAFENLRHSVRASRPPPSKDEPRASAETAAIPHFDFGFWVLKDVPSLTFKVRGYALIKANWINFPAMFDTDELDITCKLM